MKKKNLSQKLMLNKKTIVNLGNEELNAVKGGVFTDIADTCVKFTRNHDLCGSNLSLCCPTVPSWPWGSVCFKSP